MKISERTIKRLGEVITGDNALSPYRGGPKHVACFNEFGTNHRYGQGFPSRWNFTEDCIRRFNETPVLRKIILAAVDPRDSWVRQCMTRKRRRRNLPACRMQCLT